MQSNSVWIRVAGNAKNIRANEPHHWRLFIDRCAPEVPLTHFRVQGMVTVQNVVPGTDPMASNPLGLNAWIDYFGDVEVVSGVAFITLRPVDESCG